MSVCPAYPLIVQLLNKVDFYADDPDQRSRSQVKVKCQKIGQNLKMGHISDAISPTDFILGTKVQPNKAHTIT